MITGRFKYKVGIFLGIIQPLFLQEILLFLRVYYYRSKEHNKVIMEDWKLFLSSEMPQNHPSISVCVLFAVSGFDVVSSGGDVSMIYKECLEAHE